MITYNNHILNILFCRHRATVLCIALHGNHLASGSRDKSVKGRSCNAIFLALSQFHYSTKFDMYVAYPSFKIFHRVPRL